MANSAFAVGSLTNVTRWRYLDGAGSADVQYVTVKANEAVLKDDIVEMTSGFAERIVDPAGAAGVVVTGGTPFGIALKSHTADGTPTIDEDTIPIIPIDKVEILVRLVGDTVTGGPTASGSDQDSFLLDTSYVMGIYEPDTTSGNYFPVLSAQTTSGNFKIKEFSTESSSSDNYGLVWVRAS